ncbi:Uncharacterized protein FKW44_001334, partial [Caligus rogercresseyi]
DLSARAKAINCALLGAKGLVARRLTTDRSINPSELRPVLISAATRYAALDLKIPSGYKTSWTLAACVID